MSKSKKHSNYDLLAPNQNVPRNDPRSLSSENHVCNGHPLLQCLAPKHAILTCFGANGDHRYTCMCYFGRKGPTLLRMRAGHRALSAHSGVRYERKKQVPDSPLHSLSPFFSSSFQTDLMDLNFNHVPGVAHTHTHSHTHLRGRGGGGGQGWTAIEIGVGRHRQLASTQLAKTQPVHGRGRRRRPPRPCVPHTPCRPENENEEG